MLLIALGFLVALAWGVHRVSLLPGEPSRRFERERVLAGGRAAEREHVDQ